MESMKQKVRWYVCPFLLVLSILFFKDSTVLAADYPEIMLGVFFNSQEDQTDTLYVSTDGYNFFKIGVAYQDATPWDASTAWIPNTPYNVSTLHDPAIIYKDGYFWMLSGYTQWQNGSKRITPMLGCSKDLVHWSYPNSGSATNVGVTENPPGKLGANFDMVAPDMMVDDDGTVWIVASLGYYGQFHGEPQRDEMKPYLIKATGLAPGADPAQDPGAQPRVSYSDAFPINLPEWSSNRIDGSLYKENGKYYLTIKKDGVTNEIWSIDNLNEAGNASKWSKVCNDVVTGYEGPSTVKYRGKYYCFTDKLEDYPYGTTDRTNGIFVTESDGLGGLWCAPARITTQDANGNYIPNRHGSVMVVKDPAAKELVWKAREAAGYGTYDGSKKGWVTENGRRYFYEDGIKATSKEAVVEEYWRWFDADGTMAAGKDVYMRSSGGKWVRYDDQGRMVKGWDNTSRGSYYFDEWSGAMAKGVKETDKGYFYFDQTTGIRVEESGKEVYLDGYWRWFDQDGTVAVGKDVFQFSSGGKWVRYDAYGGMVKGWDYTGHGAYYFDLTTGAMAKGWTWIDGKMYYFDQTTGILQ